MSWTLALVAVPLLYVLTFPLIFFTVMPPSYTPSPGTPRRPPAWLNVYARPFFWMMDKTPPAHPLNQYGAWWRSMLE
ncbi:hypothetical protein DES53_104366 [Roseimicrobium gellanilyticum]|uniref:Uncharacterized protein n=1 Tax=Roseimicrobium gellanilyticum TaxID=748857 RepID=A0A366HPM9_9BACT|nr:hypothetical protein [Roseimicrobium gellanilyticum]RBP44545.1 hypothetical protein DES53_104366 [Roseimicrobium gellanilyticum]